MADEKGGIYEKIAAVQEEIKAVEKKGHNAFHKYDYAKEEDFLAALKPLFTKNKLVVMQVGAVQEVVGTLTCVATTYRIADAETGEFIDVTSVGQGSATDDKGAYKALTGSMKYFLAKTFLVPTGDDPESDSSAGNKGPAKNRAQTPPKAKASNLEVAMGMIKNAKDAGKLNEWKEKVKTSKLYTTDERKQILDAIEERMKTFSDVPGE